MRRIRGDRLCWLLPLLAFSACMGESSLRARDESTPHAPTPPEVPVTPAVACEPEPPPPSPLQRLTREQYDNLASELLPGTVFKPSTVLSTDEKVGRFAVNNATLVTRSVAEQYQFVAEQLAKEVAADVQRHAPCADVVAGAKACAKAFVESFGRRVFRRSLLASDVDRWLALYEKSAEANGYAQGIRSVVEGMLQSPRFVYRLELLPVDAPDEARPYPLDGPALASRLSFMIWNSAPDEALLAAAERGELSTPEGLRTHAQALLDDPRGAAGVKAFTSGWLGLSSLDDSSGTSEREGLTVGTRQKMREESEQFVDEVLRRGDGKFSTLLTAPWSVADPAVLSLYGVDAADPSGRTPLDPQQRSGVLTHASVLYAHAHAEQTSPVLRGKWIREAMLCQTVPDPPADVNTVPPAPVPGQTTRERYSQHRDDSNCSGCHALLDDVGFGFEAYDMIGRFRTQDGAAAVDDRGTLVGTDVDGDFEGVTGLAALLSESDYVQSCFATQWFRFGLSRLEQEADLCTVDRMKDALVSDAPNAHRALLEVLVTSEAFRTRRMP